MKSIILAAGRGSRMASLTHNSPKCLTTINGKTLIDHQLETLTQAGIKDIAIVTGYKAECLKQYGTHHFHNPYWERTNMVASLLCGQTWLDESDCIISYSDIFYAPQIVKDLSACEDNVAISYDPKWLDLWSKRFNNPLEDAETFRISSNNYLLSIGEKASRTEEIQGQYMGLLKFKKEFWQTLVQSKITCNYAKIDMTSFLNLLISKNYKIKALR